MLTEEQLQTLEQIDSMTDEELDSVKCIPDEEVSEILSDLGSKWRLYNSSVVCPAPVNGDFTQPPLCDNDGATPCASCGCCNSPPPNCYNPPS